MKRVKAVIPAGGEGSRMLVLTTERPKPNVPFESGRVIDLVLSNCAHTVLIDSVDVLIQAHANKLLRQIEGFAPEVAKPIRCQVAVIRGHERYAGSADALRQSQYLFHDGYNHILTLCADQIFVADYGDLIEQHEASVAAVTLMVKRYPAAEASRFGVVILNASGVPVGFLEKPDNPPLIPGTTDQSLVHMGIAIFDAQQLQQMLCEVDGEDLSRHIIPHAFASGRLVQIYEFNGYWTDIGTPRSLWLANMDLVSSTPAINLYDPSWPIIHRPRHLPSPKFIHQCQLHDAIVGNGSVIAGQIVSSVLSTRIRVGRNTRIQDSVIFDRTIVGDNVQLKRVIVDKAAQINAGVILGQDPAAEVKRYPGLVLAEDNIIIVPRGSVIA